MSLPNELCFATPKFLIAVAVISALILATIARIALYRRRNARGEAELADRGTYGALNAADIGPRVTNRLEDAVVKLVTLHRGCTHTLRVLAKEQKPVSFRHIRLKVQQEQKLQNKLAFVPASAIRAALRILLGLRFVRLDRRGFVATDLGKRLYERIERNWRTATRQSVGMSRNGSWCSERMK